jgi:hypothetical protein
MAPTTTTTALPPVSGHVRFIDNGGQRVILYDFEGMTDVPKGLEVIAEGRAFMAKLPPDGSHYTLTDVRGTRYDRRIIDAMKELATHNRPYVRAAAVVSDSAIHRAAVTMIAMVSRRKLEVFDNRENALAYLAKEHRAS